MAQRTVAQGVSIRLACTAFGISQTLAIDIDLSLPSERVVRALDQIIEWRGKPQIIRSDNGPEYISGTFIAWAERRGYGLAISWKTSARSTPIGDGFFCPDRTGFGIIFSSDRICGKK